MLFSPVQFLPNTVSDFSLSPEPKPSIFIVSKEDLPTVLSYYPELQSLTNLTLHSPTARKESELQEMVNSNSSYLFTAKYGANFLYWHSDIINVYNFSVIRGNVPSVDLDGDVREDNLVELTFHTAPQLIICSLCYPNGEEIYRKASENYTYIKYCPYRSATYIDVNTIQGDKHLALVSDTRDRKVNFNYLQM